MASRTSNQAWSKGLDAGRARRTIPFKLAGGGGQFSRLLAAEVSTSAVVMLDTPCSEVV